MGRVTDGGAAAIWGCLAWQDGMFGIQRQGGVLLDERLIEVAVGKEGDICVSLQAPISI